MGWKPSRLGFLRRRWWVRPKTTHGRHQLSRQVSMGAKQPKNELNHGWALSGDLELRYSLGRATTSLNRDDHSATSSLLMGPCWAGCCC